MANKIFFFDIDNTLLDHKTNLIPASALEAIARLKAAGHVIAIATGRGYGHAQAFVEQVQPTYTITQNGARILKGQEVVSKTTLPQDALLELFQLIESKGFCYGINDGLIGHVSGLVPEVTIPMDSVEIAFEQDLDFYRTSEIFQAWMFFHESLDAVMVPELLARFPQFDYVRWHETGMDVMPKGVNKMRGCEWVLADAQIDVRHAYAFGDGLNDIEMLQGVGTGIAMGNAHPKLKAVADRVAPSIDDDGIAKMIDQLQMEFAQ